HRRRPRAHLPVRDRRRRTRPGGALARGGSGPGRRDWDRPGGAQPGRAGARPRRAVARRRPRRAGGGRRASAGGRREGTDAHRREGGRGGCGMISVDWLLIIVVVAAVLFFLGSFIRVVPEYERGIIFRLRSKTRAVFTPGGDGNGPGLILLVPFIDKVRQRISLRTIATDVPPQDVITCDNVSINVNAVIFFRVVNPEQAFLSVEDYMYATSQLSQTTLRSVLGQMELDDLLSARDKVNQQLQRIIDEHTEPWGVKVSTVEVKQIDLPQDMQRAMSKQAEAERERRAKVINADGEFQAAAKLAEAAEVLMRFPVALQLRYLQTMREIASERNTTTFFPLPMDLIGPLLNRVGAESPKP